MAPTLRVVDPTRLADLTLAAAVRSSADAVYIEPGKAEASYVILMERAQQIVAEVTIDGLSGAATIARLALIAGLDLASSTASSAVVKVRSGDRIADVVVTMRPGTGLRADLMVVQKSKPLVTAVPAANGAPATGQVGDVV